MTPDELLEAARKNGLTVTSKGVNAQVLDRAPGPSAIEAQITLLGHVVRACRTEAVFQKCVLDLAKLCGWRAVVTRKVLVKGKGGMRYETPFNAEGIGTFDCDFYRERNFKAELKAKGGTVSDDQKQWKLRYDQAGVENYIWWPKNWDEIVKVFA